MDDTKLLKTFSRHSSLRYSSFKFVVLVRKRNFGGVRIRTPENLTHTNRYNTKSYTLFAVKNISYCAFGPGTNVVNGRNYLDFLSYFEIAF